MSIFRDFYRVGRFPGTTLVAALALLPAGCAQPIGPTVQILPQPQKPFAVFEADERDCSLYTNAQVKPLVDRSAAATLGTMAIGTVLGVGLGAALGGGRGAAIGAAAGALGGSSTGADQASQNEDKIQAFYNNTYSACMVARGNLLPAPPVLQQTVVVAPPAILVQPAPYVVQPPAYLVPAP